MRVRVLLAAGALLAAVPLAHVDARQSATARPVESGVGLAGATVAPAMATAATPADPGYGGRTVTTGYVDAGGVSGGTAASTFLAQPGPAVASLANEDQVRMTATDATGLAVAVQLDYTPRGAAAPVSILVCSATGWLPIKPATTVRATVVAGRCPDGRASTPTRGSVVLAFHRMVVVASGVALPAKRWAVIVGISHYRSPTEPTYGGDGDATAVRRALLHAGWRADHILDIRDGAATAAAISHAMTWLVRHSAPDTFTLFHYSGHVCIHTRGPCPTGHTYLWGADNRFISEQSVGATLSRLRGHAWVDIAGCESGAFNVHIASKLRLFTASSQPGRTSYEEPSWRESVWAGLTWDQAYLQGAATRGRPYLATIGQMVAYGVHNAPVVTNGQSAGTQHPYVRGANAAWKLTAPPG